MLQTALQFTLNIFVFVAVLIAVMFVIIKTSLFFTRLIADRKYAKVMREASPKYGEKLAELEKYLQAVYAGGSGAFAPNTGLDTPELGHYIADCDCEHCAYAARNNGLNLGPYFDELTGLNNDGVEVALKTSPIATCTCKHCRSARSEGKAEKTLTEAHAIQDELNKWMGYAL